MIVLRLVLSRVPLPSIALILLSLPAAAAIPLADTPAWESTPNGHVATGGAWSDVNGDGWLDMVVANGNDIERQSVVIYHNNGDGTLPLNPTWSSLDIDYHGHIDIGDVNGDGIDDVAVAVFLGPGGFGDPGKVKVYYGNGAAYSSTPDWESTESFYCFSVALGDADGDGDLDLACATGEPYGQDFEHHRIFFNDNGTLETVASWKTDDVEAALDVFWDDVDLDGDMDVVFCGIWSPLQLHVNGQTDGGGIPTAPTWENTDLPQQGNTAAFGDWDGDGFPELAVADNLQLAGSGRFKVYQNNSGALETTPVWSSQFGGYGSHVSWIDLDFDGDRDLATGRWFDDVEIFENAGGSLPLVSTWDSATNSVIENIFWGDVDNDGLRSNGVSFMTGDGVRTFFRLGQYPVRSVDAVLIDGVPTTDFVKHLANGWISFESPPSDGAHVRVDFTYSWDLDMGISNWDSGVGNYVFLNDGTADAPEMPPTVASSLTAYPNPVTRSTKIRYASASPSAGRLAVYDAAGRRVRTLHEGPIGEGLRLWEWDRTSDSGRPVAAGTYYAKLSAGGVQRAFKLIVLDGMR